MKLDLTDALKNEFKQTLVFNQEPAGVKDRLRTVHELLNGIDLPKDAKGAYLLVSQAGDKPFFHRLDSPVVVGRGSTALQLREG